MKHSPDSTTRALIIGKSGFLASAVLRIESDDLAIDAISHTADITTVDVDRYDVVVNMALDPSYMSQPYSEERDFDLKIARLIVKTHAQYVLMSSRRVYGAEAPFHIPEECSPEPTDNYGRNKLKTEIAVQDLLGDRCTTLRIANVFGFELGRRSFFGIALGNLKSKNQIVLDTSPFVSRDFIYIDHFAQILRSVLLRRPKGIFNLGSGRATSLGKIALSIIEGYGRGDLVVTSPEERDSFELDTRKLTSYLGSQLQFEDVLTTCREIGRRLSNE